MINIIDGFYLGSGTPIDNRFVVANTTLRDAIVYKYNGLKVFVESNRLTYVWNSTTSLWESDTSGTSGTGDVNYVAKWTDSTTIGTSSIYATGSYVGFGTISPKSSIQINGIANPFSINHLSGKVVNGYNWWNSGVDETFDSLSGSSLIEFNSDGAIIFKLGNASESLQTILSLNKETSGIKYNVINKPTLGANFVSGTFSVSSSSTPFSGGQLVNIDGSLRTNDLYNKVTYLTVETSQIKKQVGYNKDGSISAETTIGGLSYAVSDDNVIIVKQSTGASITITLPTISTSNSFGLGRVIEVKCEGTSTSFIGYVSSSTTIVGQDGASTSPTFRVGDNLCFISIRQGSNMRWKIIYNKMYENLRTLNSTDRMYLRQPDNSYSFLRFNSITDTSLSSTLNLKATIGGTSRFELNHDFGGYSTITNYGHSTGVGSGLYIISSNNSNSTNGEFIKIQTRNLNISGSITDPSILDGSIQIASKSTIDLISQGGVYYLGARLVTGAGTDVLPPITTGSKYVLMLDETTGQIFRSAAASSGSSTSKTFVINHPDKKDKYLVHAVIEGPENAVFYRGKDKLINGKVEITLPEYFESLTNNNRTILITSITGKTTDVLSTSEVINGKFEVSSILGLNLEQEFYWEVKAERSDISKLESEPSKKDFYLNGDGPYTYLTQKSFQTTN